MFRSRPLAAQTKTLLRPLRRRHLNLGRILTSAAPDEALWRFFLDTSVHIERHAGSGEVRRTIRDLLDEEHHATSSHARREWKAAIEAATAEVLNAIDDSEDLRDLAARCGQGWGRRPGQRWRVISMLAGGRLDDLDAMAIRTRTFIRSESQALFEHRVEVRNGSDCGLAKERVMEEPSGRFLFAPSAGSVNANADRTDFGGTSRSCSCGSGSARRP